MSTPGTEADFSVCDCDVYIEHLRNLSLNEQLVVATEDVGNEFGVVLLRRGSPLGEDAARRMLGHRLVRPVDELLALRRRTSSEELVGRFLDMLESDPDLLRASERLDFEGRLRQLCHGLDWPDTMMQRLAVMRRAMPRVFHRALFCAWLGALIAAERKLPAEEIELVFRAGLCHDFGLLHIPPELVDKRADIGDEEWRTIQRHVDLGARVAAQLAAVPPRLQRLVLEHHERHDGAGYPQGRLGPDLDPLSGILALADMLHGLRFQNLLLGGGNLADHMPYLRVNRRTFGIENYKPAARILLAARDSRAAAPQPGASTLSVQGLLDANQSLTVVLGELQSARELLEALPEGGAVASLTSLLDHAQWVAQASGLGTETLSRSLEQAIPGGRQDAGVEDIRATTQEILWLLRRVERRLQDLLHARQGGERSAALRDLALRINAELTRAMRRMETPAQPS